MKLLFITGNKGKFEEAKHILDGWDLTQKEIDLPEIQGSSEEVILAKAKKAMELVNEPLVVEDVSIRLKALNGFPGPYIKDLLKAIGFKGVAELVHKYEDHKAEAVCLVAFAKPGEEPTLFEGKIEGTIVMPKGELQHGKFSWNPIFKPDGLDHTFGEMSMEEHAKISHRKEGFEKLRKHLETHEMTV